MYNLVLLFLAIVVLAVGMWWLGYYQQRVLGIIYSLGNLGVMVYLLQNRYQSFDRGERIFIWLFVIGWLIFLIDLWRKGRRERRNRQSVD